MNFALQMPGGFLNALLWAHHFARAEKQLEIRLRHLVLGIVVTYSEQENSFSSVISSDTAKSILSDCGVSVPAFEDAGIKPVPRSDMPVSAEVGEILRKLMQTGGSLQHLTVDDLLRAVIPSMRESLEEEEREAQLERQISLILRRRRA